MSRAPLFDALAGTWRFTRTVTLGVHMQGTARFAPVSDVHLAYLEAGEILETRIEFTRAYDYLAQGNDLAVFYADGPEKGSRFLYFENLLAGSFPYAGKASHLCGRDHYAADFTFVSNTVFFTHYDILGPEKAHGITTEYAKL